MQDVNDVTVWPGSSTSPPSDPRRETVWYGLGAKKLGAKKLGAKKLGANRVVAGFPEIRFYLHKEFRDRQIRFYLHKEYVRSMI